METLLHGLWVLRENFKVSLLDVILEMELVTIAIMALNLITLKSWAGRFCLLLLDRVEIHIIICD